jgi:hypothetical protein
VNPNLDQLLVFTAIGAAIGFFAVRFFRQMQAKDKGCGTGGCCTPSRRPQFQARK